MNCQISEEYQWQPDVRNAFFVAAGHLVSLGIVGGEAEVKKAVDALLSPDHIYNNPRGFVHQVIRLSQLIKSGMHLNSLSGVIEKNFNFRGWFIGADHFEANDFYQDVEADAMAGKTIIEIKTLGLLDKEQARCLIEMLSPGQLIVTSSLFLPGKQPITNQRNQRKIRIVYLFANQLLKYRQFIGSEKAEKLELHLTSSPGIPVKVADAIYDMFSPGSVEIIWYRKPLGDTGITIAPLEVKANEFSEVTTPPVSSPPRASPQPGRTTGPRRRGG